MGKVVYNDCYGGFNISDAAFRRYLKLSSIPFETSISPGLGHSFWKFGKVGDHGARLSSRDIHRDDPILVSVVEKMGSAANTYASNLKVFDVPVGEYWRVDEYDGMETIMTRNDYNWTLST